MVKMFESDAERFPRLRQFVQFDLPQVPKRKPGVYEQFLRFSELSDAEGRQALSWGKYPLLKVRVQDPFGQYHQGAGEGRRRGNMIYFADRLATAFELAHNYQNVHRPDDPDRELIPKSLIAEARLLAEAIILHEIVHWGDYHKDFAQGSIEGGNFMSREMGITFEGAAYGKATVRPARFQHLQQYFPFLWQQAATGHAAH